MLTHSLLLLTTLAAAVVAKPCVQFDTAWNLYAFGGSGDVALGGSGSWAQPAVTPLTSTGRPPWTGNNTLCLLSQYNNAMYVLNADAANPSNLYIFDFTAKTWSTQTTTSPPDLSTGSTTLDHDTNVLYTLPASSSATGTLYFLDLSTVTKTATGTAIPWTAALSPSFGMSGYNPVLASSSNHINFFGVPNTAAGSANIFVIHYSYFQPTVQAYPTVSGGASFPDSHGVALSIPAADNSAPDQMLFIPDSFTNTFVVTHWTSPSTVGSTSDAPSGISSFINTTQLLPAPTSKDPSSSYAASDVALVQIDSTGAIYYITSAISNYAVSSSATWTKMGYTLAGVSSSGAVTTAASASATGSSTGSSTGTGTGTGTTKVSSTGTGTVSASSAAATSAKSGAMKVQGVQGWVGGLVGVLAAVGAGLVM